MLHVLSTAPLGDCDLRSGVSRGFPCTSPRCCFSLFNFSLPFLHTFLPLGNQLIPIILSSSFLATAAHHVLGHRSPPRHSRATDYSSPSCTFSARHLWVTVIFGRVFQVVFLICIPSSHLTALLLATAAPLISPSRAARSQHGTFR